MGPPQKQVHIYVSSIAAAQPLTETEALPKGVIQMLCKGGPYADGTRLSTGKAGVEESMQTRRGKATQVTKEGSDRIMLWSRLSASKTTPYP